MHEDPSCQDFQRTPVVSLLSTLQYWRNVALSAPVNRADHVDGTTNTTGLEAVAVDVAGLGLLVLAKVQHVLPTRTSHAYTLQSVPAT